MGYKENIDEFFQNNKFLTKVLYFIGFIVSGYFSYLGLSTNSKHMIEFSIFDIIIKFSLVWLAYTFVWECGKALMYMAYVKTKQRKFLYMWIMTTVFSICFSMAFLLIQDNIETNNKKISNVLLEQKKDKEVRLKKQLEDKQGLFEQAKTEKEKAIVSLPQDKENLIKQIAEYNKTIKSLQTQITNANGKLQEYKNKGYDNKQYSKQKEIDQLTDNLNKTIIARDNSKIEDKVTLVQNNINTLDNDIKELNKQLDNITYDDIPGEASTSSLLPLFEVICSILPFDISTKVISGIFDLCMSTGFEVMICYLYSLSYIGHGGLLPTGGGNGRGRNIFNDTMDNLSNKFKGLKNMFKKVNKQSVPTAQIESIDSNIDVDLTLESNKNKILSSKFKIKKMPNKKKKIEPTKFKIKKKPKKKEQLKQLDNVREFKPQIVSSTLFVDNPDFDNKELRKYLNFMYNKQNLAETKNGLTAPGYDRISKSGLGLSNKTCRAIHGTLRTLGAITTKGTSTIILKSKNETLQLCGLRKKVS